MPVEVRVGERVEKVAMAGGNGQLTVAKGDTVTLDPHSRVLRRAEHIEDFQKFKEEQAKAKKG